MRQAAAALALILAGIAGVVAASAWGGSTAEQHEEEAEEEDRRRTVSRQEGACREAHEQLYVKGGGAPPHHAFAMHGCPSPAHPPASSVPAVVTQERETQEMPCCSARQEPLRRRCPRLHAGCWGGSAACPLARALRWGCWLLCWQAPSEVGSWTEDRGVNQAGAALPCSPCLPVVCRPRPRRPSTEVQRARPLPLLLTPAGLILAPMVAAAPEERGIQFVPSMAGA